MLFGVPRGEREFGRLLQNASQAPEKDEQLSTRVGRNF
jgi:hypothetical protein